MHSTAILATIDRIAATQSKNEKVAILAEHASSPEFVKVLKLAYDPFINFGVAHKTLDGMHLSEGFAGSLEFHDATWKMLDDLSERTLSGSAAINAIVAHLAVLNAPSGLLLRRILLKDLRAGFSESSVNKAIPGTLPEYPYMRCSLPEDVKLDEWVWSDGQISQEKSDGMFVNVNVDKVGYVWVTTRQGTDFPIEKVPALEQAIQRLEHGTQTHGELLVVYGTTVLEREIGNGHLNSVLNGGELEEGLSLRLNVWDQIPLSEVKPKGKYNVPYATRLGLLGRQVLGARSPLLHLSETKIVFSLDEAKADCRRYTSKGKEGTVLKNRNAIWRDGTSPQQVKFKVTFEVDLKIVGFEAGKGKRAATFGSIITESSEGQLRVSVSGFTDEQIAEIHANRESYLQTIMAVSANKIMEPKKKGGLWSLFLPRYAEFRKDKVEADSLERVQAQYHAAMGIA